MINQQIPQHRLIFPYKAAHAQYRVEYPSRTRSGSLVRLGSLEIWRLGIRVRQSFLDDLMSHVFMGQLLRHAFVIVGSFLLKIC